MSNAREDVRFWNDWNARTRERALGRTETDQRAQVLAWTENIVAQNGRLEIIDVGCGAGWLTADLLQWGNATGTDLSDEVLARAQARWPDAKFVAGDFMELDLGEGAYDLVVSLEVIAHVRDQSAFVAKLAKLLKPGASLIIATQNRPVLKLNKLAKAHPAQIRRHLNIGELSELLAPHFDVATIRFLTPIFARRILPDRITRAFSKGSRIVFRDHLRRWLEDRGLGWSIMVLATKRP